ncbi:hypothetical protein Pst134EA_002585 [Puccinia striiformis f. sp. tritici]|uniref:hypothetical protein n=1 Tax=Puccinia striiformis f. sp. tritici TaxID=168172 RepID=UPI0020087A42|nr:hypothetical protein Pst134EA_002585 [Puccinia striiformis f. sp. tritici]KAH9471956.1 hypothetical protein Pst134EA_002585 [Puccinia striiformis f. sp. tritici]
MSTRANAGTLLPPSDPEVIIRTANAAARRKAKINAALANHSETPKPYTFPPNLDDLPPLPTSPKMSNPSKDPPQSGSSSHSDLPLQDYLKGVIKLQHNSIDQANLDRHAMHEFYKANEARRKEDAARIARLEESIILLTVKQENVEAPTRREEG